MTDKISNEARDRFLEHQAHMLYHVLFKGNGVCVRELCISQALGHVYKVSRNQALEDAAEISEKTAGCCAAEIRAMKVLA